MATSVKRAFVDGRYGQIHTRVARSESSGKPAIVCLHMSPKSGQSYADLLPYLAIDRLALAPDFPGHGESDLPPPEPHVTIEDFADAVWTVIDAHSEGPVHLLGYHTGAMVAVEAAYQRPNDVISIVSVSAPVFTEEECAALDGAYSPIPIDAEGNRFRIMWERVLFHRGPGMTMRMAAASFAENLRAGDNYEWGHRAAFAYSKKYNQRLGEIEQPIFVMNPADDCFEQSKRADAIMRNGKRRDYEHWGHGFLSAFPEAAAAEVLAFIESVENND